MKFSQNTQVISKDWNQALKEPPTTIQTPNPHPSRIGGFVYCFLSDNTEPEFSSVFHMILAILKYFTEAQCFPQILGSCVGRGQWISCGFATALRVSPKPPSGSKPVLQHFTFIWILKLCSANSTVSQQPGKSPEKKKKPWGLPFCFCLFPKGAQVVTCEFPPHKAERGKKN